jgi:uncharacterized protein YoxC
MQELAEHDFELPGDLSQYSETEIVEYVNGIVRELADTRSQQIKLGKRVSQLSNTVSALTRTLGTLTHNHDQLDAKVRSLVQNVNHVQDKSQKALLIADEAIRDVWQLREETKQQFQRVNENLGSLGLRINQFIDNV